MLPSFASHPEGMSTENILSWNFDKDGESYLKGDLRSPIKGKPNIASMIKSFLDK
jgi:hypothetical protein